MNNQIENNIRRFRELKGYSQEYMAQELGISQSSYAKIENGSTKITIDRLQQIAEILDIEVSSLISSSKQPIFNQKNEKGAYGNGYVENLHVENKEMTEKLLAEKDKLILKLEKDIEFLKKLLE